VRLLDAFSSCGYILAKVMSVLHQAIKQGVPLTLRPCDGGQHFPGNEASVQSAQLD
jgi:hypothetical protein